MLKNSTFIYFVLGISAIIHIFVSFGFLYIIYIIDLLFNNLIVLLIYYLIVLLFYCFIVLLFNCFIV